MFNQHESLFKNPYQRRKITILLDVGIGNLETKNDALLNMGKSQSEMSKNQKQENLENLILLKWQSGNLAKSK